MTLLLEAPLAEPDLDPPISDEERTAAPAPRSPQQTAGRILAEAMLSPSPWIF